MSSIIERIKNGHFWKFHGGVHPPEQKFLTNNKPIRTVGLPDELILPLQQHIGQAGDLCVKVGDSVLKGQQLTSHNSPMAVPVHAPTSGVITAIKPSVLAHPSGLSDMCIFITPDGKNTWRERNICDDFYTLSRESIINKIANAGIAGMGGAGFPTHIKVNTKPVINYLIINAAECEPYITADDLLIREQSPTIIDGIKILDHLLLPEYILIGIEDNKPDAIKALKQATKSIEKIHVCVLPTKYPTGGEKQLIKALTGEEVPSGKLPIDLGIVTQNIATCFAIADAIINDSPLISRVVTVSGQALEKPQNVWALLGTPVNYLLKQCGYQKTTEQHLIMGGPMMGFSLSNDNVPIIKTTNCILAPSEIEISSTNKEVDCIRCGQCAEVCPSQLLPQELQWSAKAKDHEQLKKLNLFDCIDCGACAYVCPSQIPLVQYYRVAKAQIRQQQILDIKAENAKTRFEARKMRLEQEKIAREAKHKLAAEARKAMMNNKTPEAENAKSAVAAALARVKAKKENSTSSVELDNNSVPVVAEVAHSSKNTQVSAAIARAKAKKLAAQTKNTTVTFDTDTNTDTLPSSEIIDKKGQIAQALLRAKAKAKLKKQAKNDESEHSPLSSVLVIENTKDEQSQNNTITDSNKLDNFAKSEKDSKVASIIAKAKAKKMASLPLKDNEEVKSTTVTNNALQPKDNVEKIIGKEKIKTITPTLTEDHEAIKTEVINKAVIDKKVKVAEVIAKAKAKKLAEQSKIKADDCTDVIATDVTIDIDRKTKVAAAVAKAKAKRQQKIESK